MRCPLDGVLALGRRPPDVQGIDAMRSNRCACAAFFVNAFKPAFAATYGARKAWEPWEEIDEMFTIDPGTWRSRKWRTAACMMKNGAGG
jgi:hypothetical protein